MSASTRTREESEGKEGWKGVAYRGGGAAGTGAGVDTVRRLEGAVELCTVVLVAGNFLKELAVHISTELKRKRQLG